MPLTIIERVAQAVQAQLQTIATGITNASGYTYTSTPGKVIRPARYDRVVYDDYDIAISQEARERDDQNSAQGNPPSVAWEHRFRIRGIRLPDDRSEESIDAAINAFQADIEAALTVDFQWGGLAINTQIMGSEDVLSEESAKVGVDVIVHITYAHAENNPTVLRT